MRFAVVISHPIQHFAPLFARLAASPEIQLKVFYCCDWGVNAYRDPGFGQSLAWDIPLLEGYEYEFLPIAKRPEALTFRAIDNPDVGQRLKAFRPDAVWIHGYSHRTSWRAYRWAHGRARILYFGDSELLAPRRRLVRWAKSAVLPWFFRGCDGFLTIGDQNEAYYRHYGVPESKMFRGSFPIDVKRFQDAVKQLTPTDRQTLRQKYGLSPDSLVVLFSGKLIDIKRPLDLVDAVATLRDQTPRIEALFLGSGPLEPALRARIAAAGLEDRVRLAGFVNQSEIPKVLWLGDVLAMCSEKDPHPLAVSEAMAVGNAIVASDRVGCVGPTDAARPGTNVLTYPCGDVAALAQRLQNLAEHPELLKQMREASKELAMTQDVERAAEAVARFLVGDAEQPSTQNSVLNQATNG